MHDMWTIANDDPGGCNIAVQKNAEFEVRFGLKTLGGPRNIVLDRGHDPPMISGGNFGHCTTQEWLNGSRSGWGWRLLGIHGTLY